MLLTSTNRGIVPDPFRYILVHMDPLYATPSIAEAAGYIRVRVMHCGSVTEFPFRFLPERPLREMRFRCKRCGARLSAEEAGARWTWQGETSLRGDGPKPTLWEDIHST